MKGARSRRVYRIGRGGALAVAQMVEAGCVSEGLEPALRPLDILIEAPLQRAVAAADAAQRLHRVDELAGALARHEIFDGDEHGSARRIERHRQRGLRPALCRTEVEAAAFRQRIAVAEERGGDDGEAGDE